MPGHSEHKYEVKSMDLKVQQSEKYLNPQGIATAPYMNRRGEQFVMDWKQAAILEGYGFIANVGAFSTPVVGGGNGTVADLDQPEFGMLIPSGTTVVPLRTAIQLTAPLLATDADECEAFAYVDTTAATVAAALDGTWTTTITPKNMKIALTNVHASLCTVKSACTADTTDPTESIDLFHSQITGDVQGTPANALWTRHNVLYEPKENPYIVGPACLFVHWGGTVATSGFMQFFWLELPSTHVS
jgi:hypothetical protein